MQNLDEILEQFKRQIENKVIQDYLGPEFRVRKINPGYYQYISRSGDRSIMIYYPYFLSKSVSTDELLSALSCGENLASNSPIDFYSCLGYVSFIAGIGSFGKLCIFTKNREVIRVLKQHSWKLFKTIRYGGYSKVYSSLVLRHPELAPLTVSHVNLAVYVTSPEIIRELIKKS